ncbi:hypothetical protein BDF19DRAFT_411246 [Syncephalis fuscata]|nr:hypothetical protein BDF19DRAFT_411246 [Syncephalis fuscata]
MRRSVIKRRRRIGTLNHAHAHAHAHAHVAGTNSAIMPGLAHGHHPQPITATPIHSLPHRDPPLLVPAIKAMSLSPTAMNRSINSTSTNGNDEGLHQAKRMRRIEVSYDEHLPNNQHHHHRHHLPSISQPPSSFSPLRVPAIEDYIVPKRVPLSMPMSNHPSHSLSAHHYPMDTSQISTNTTTSTSSSPNMDQPPATFNQHYNATARDSSSPYSASSSAYTSQQQQHHHLRLPPLAAHLSHMAAMPTPPLGPASSPFAPPTLSYEQESSVRSPESLEEKEASTNMASTSWHAKHPPAVEISAPMELSNSFSPIRHRRIYIRHWPHWPLLPHLLLVECHQRLHSHQRPRLTRYRHPY